VSCTGASEYIISAAQLEKAAGKESALKLIVDMAVPRDIERPENSDFELDLIDLEDLNAFRKNQMKIRKEEIPAAKRVIEDMVCTFQSWMEGAFDPSVGALVKEYDRIRKSSVKAALASFLPDDHEALEQFSRDMMRGLLKIPTKTFLNNAKNNGVDREEGQE